MLIHYFGSRENIEHGAIGLLEDGLRKQFAPANFPAGVSPATVVMRLWQRTIAMESKSVLLLVMDISRRAWRGDPRALAFCEEQQRLWTELLLNFIPNRQRVEELLQVFQGTTLAFLITGDPEPGRRALLRAAENPRRSRERLK